MIEAETVIERRRLRRRLTLWRLLAVVLAVFFIALLATGNQRFAGSGSFLPHIARVSVSGLITDDQKMLELLDKVGKSSQVRAVILDVNSPGGTTTGGEAMYDAIRQLAEKKPVVAVCGLLPLPPPISLRSPPTASSSTATPSPARSASSSNGPTSLS